VICKDAHHDFEKFDDSRIFCRKCGEVRMVAAAPIQWRPYPVYPQSLPWWYTTVGTTTVTSSPAPSTYTVLSSGTDS
jgi:hypothetical protein